MSEPLLTGRELDELRYHLDHLLRPGSGTLGTLAGTTIRYLSGILGAEGVPCEVVEADDGRPCLVSRLSAHRPDEALLLVAAADPLGDPPGNPRSALQGPAMAAVALMALALVRRRGLVPSRDLVLAVLPGRGPDGMPPLRGLASRHLGRLRCRLALTSDGVGPRTTGDRTLVGVQVASKAMVRVRIRSKADPSATGPDAAPMRLVRSLLLLESGVLATRPCVPATEWMDAVIPTLPTRQATMLRGMQLLGAGTVLSRLVPDRELASTLASITHDTVEVVALRSGAGSGLDAGVAEADLVLRVLPGRRSEECVRDLEASLGAEVAIETVDAVEAVEMSHPTPMWTRIAATVAQTVPGALPLPTLSAEAWDAAALAPLDATAYGFGPLSVLADSDLAGPEGPSISSEALARGSEAFLRIVLGTCVPERFPLDASPAR